MIEGDLIYMLKVGMYEIRKNKEVIGGKSLENPPWRKIDIWTRNAYLKKYTFQSFIWYKICENPSSFGRRILIIRRFSYDFKYIGPWFIQQSTRA